MATWGSRVRTVKTKEWIVPAREPYGAAHNEVLMIIELARKAVQEKKKVHPESPDPVHIYDNEVTVHCRDDEIVVSITLEDTVSAS